VGSSTNCYSGDSWDTSLCPDPDSCSKNCALDGASYQSTYGITTSGDSASFKLVTVGQVSAGGEGGEGGPHWHRSTLVPASRQALRSMTPTSAAGERGVRACASPPPFSIVSLYGNRRVYVSDSQSTYKLFMLKNREFTFDVDVSQLPCGM